MQIRCADDMVELQVTLSIDEIESLLCETEYRKPLKKIKLEDKEEVISILLDYYLIIKHKCCLDQFGEGLQTLGILSAVQRNPCLWKTLFVTSDAGLSTGKVLKNVQVVTMKCILYVYA